MNALTIAGSDSGGGAGIQADLKTFAALGVHGTSAITAITAQNSREVRAVHDVPADIIRKQIKAIMDDIPISAIKIGMLSKTGIINAVADEIANSKVPIVLDPVMIAASGAKLLEDDAIWRLRERLIPLAGIITPNIPEAEVLCGFDIECTEDMVKACRSILKLGCGSVLLKGGHLKGDDVTDIFYDGQVSEFRNKRIGKEGHGTGCTLSSAIAAHLARKMSMKDAVSRSIRYVHHALASGYKAGSQNYVLDHFWK